MRYGRNWRELTDRFFHVRNILAENRMTNTELEGIRKWFEDHVQTYASPTGTFPPLLQLKVEHSERVARDSRSLAGEMEWISADVNVAEAVGWLHDVGRFSQFAEFGTFSDRHSVDHGHRGWEVLKESNVLAALDGRDKDAILTSVRYHNARTIPEHVGSRAKSYASGGRICPGGKLPDASRPPVGRTRGGQSHPRPVYLALIRDADKLDIFRIVHDAVERDGFQELADMLPQVQLDAPISPVLLEELERRRCGSLEHVGSRSDYLLMQLSWVYDINYSSTFRRIVQRGIVRGIARELPLEDSRVRGIVQAAERYVDEQT
ncbi:MAG: HD domain-containing protein [Planctomycetota bacterium]